MTGTVRNIDQRFWHNKALAHLTIRTTQNSRQSYKAHSHSELSIGIITSGVTQLSLPNETRRLNTGDLVMIEPHVVHACNPVGGQPRSYHMLYIDNTWCCQLLSNLYGYDVQAYRCFLDRLSASATALRLADTIASLYQSQDRNTLLSIEAAIFHLVSRYCSPYCCDEDNEHLATQLKDHLLEDITNPPPLDVISQKIGRSTETLIRLFKKHYGITPKSFLNNHRIEKAKLLLKRGMRIVDVSAEVGFCDQSQFHRSFVHYTASTPRQYQQITSIFDNNS